MTDPEAQRYLKAPQCTSTYLTVQTASTYLMVQGISRYLKTPQRKLTISLKIPATRYLLRSFSRSLKIPQDPARRLKIHQHPPHYLKIQPARSRPHLRDGIIVDEVLSVGCERGVEGDEVSFPPDVGEVHELDAELGRRVLWEGRVEPDHVHAAFYSNIREGEGEGQGEGGVR